jgi:hypothetical protein
MKRWKKIALVLLGLILISQIPFAYRRYRLGRLHAAIGRLSTQHTTQPAPDGFAEYKGVMHVHSFLGGHSPGTFDEIIKAANANQLNFVVMTEHPSQNFDTAAMTLKGSHAGMLFVNGNEVASNNQDRLLVLPGDQSAAQAGGNPTADLLSQARTKQELTFIAYPDEYKSWSGPRADGIEVYNLFTNSKRINPIITFFDGLWSYRSYPDLLFATFYERPSEALKLWDDQTAGGKRLVATAGNDAHANVGLSLNDSAGKTILGIKLDPYERSFRLVRMHVLVSHDQGFDTERLLSALRDGHCFIGFDLFGDSTGFRFTATNSAEQKIQGDEIPLGNGVRLAVTTPQPARIVLFRNGVPQAEESNVSGKEFAVGQPGVYRVEIYLTQLPAPVNSRPWIISNPIYVL